MSVDPNHPGPLPPAVPHAALTGACAFANQTLPEPLPADPFPTVVAWLEDARRLAVQPNPNAMTLATVDADGRPAARIVLCRSLNAQMGHLTFFTNYDGRKGAALASHPFAALVMHWDALDRQVRIEGRVVRAPAAESDAYFQSRPLLSRVAAWASAQSRPIDSRAALIAQNAQAEARFGVVRGRGGDADASIPPGMIVPRPPNWGGFRVWADRVELWLGHTSRLHDRAVWMRDLTPDADEGFKPGPWSSMRLQP